MDAITMTPTKRLFKNSLYVIFLIGMESCLTSDEQFLPFESYVPTELNDGIILSTPEAENIDNEALVDIYNGIVADKDFWPLKSLLVFRNNKLVSEAYFKSKNDILEKTIVWSCTKQILAMVVGKAVEQGHIGDLNDPISKYFTSELDNHQDKASITLHNLLTMQSGIEFENNGLSGDNAKLQQQIPDSSIDYIMDLKLSASQGTIFDYNDANPHLISAIIQKKVGKPTDEWANEVLFSKIGFKNYSWERYKDGITMGGWGIKTTPREMAKLAICVADSGLWQGEQLLGREWIREMTTVKVPQTTEEGLSFGYYWWVDRTRNTILMDGHGGQFAFIIPEKALIVLMTSLPNTQGKQQIFYDEAFRWVDKIVEIAY
jgi:CubicO group peptidase (beta-lactamase class C family)